eukprot:CAMPEP_0181363492 /NCGR_PEP_ID=MMETSP1106-20121128/8776_1 /TAXON_ID=81844 /ORGANISM="Mantoniella antarctica, Strain SL-175" /LENGTH=85 /DNA_ID=CAMNT_0023477931 /DNA_START=452 /DNA_END=706 /DNA_ORIENTATION=+
MTSSWVTSPTTVTFWVSRFTSKELTPSILPNTRSTAPEHPEHIIATLRCTVVTIAPCPFWFSRLERPNPFFATFLGACREEMVSA